MFKSINGGKLPTRATKFSAGVDVFSAEDVIIGTGETAIIPLGVIIDIDNLKKCVPDYREICKFYEDTVIKRQLSKIHAMETKNYVINEKLNTFKKTHYISLKPRSSLRAKGLISHSAVIDFDFKDEIKMIIHNPLQLIGGICSDEIIYKEDFKKALKLIKVIK